MIQLSIVIPSRDAGARLTRCLEHLAMQRDADGTFEVIVVDDGSQPAVSAGRLPAGLPFPMQILRRDVSGGIAVGRNAGWRVALGRVCLFLDDDIVTNPTLVRDHLRAHDAEEPRIGVGRLTTHVSARADWLARAFADTWNAHDRALGNGRAPKAGDCYGGDLSIPTELLHRTGGFDEAFGRSEDIELAARLVELGARPIVVGQASRHEERKTGRNLLADARRNGATARQLVRAHPWLLGETELGAFAATGQRGLLARRLLAALPPPPPGVVRAGELVGRGRVGRRLSSLLVHQAFWAGAREGIDPAEYSALADGTAILMYHGFAPAGERASRYVVPAERFESQLSTLLRLGHRPVRMADYREHRRDDAVPPARSFVVTIDDGYAEVESLAVPVLRRLGIPATLFLVEGAIGRSNTWDRIGPLAGRPILDRAALDRVRHEGIEVAPHSASHRRLVGLGATELEQEIGQATAALRDRVGDLVPAFAYPFGAADDAARLAVSGAGLTGIGVREGLACPASPEAELPRIEVRGGDSPLRVAIAARLGGTRRMTRP